jgi:UDP-N-acetylmuramyl-tripeptide synthetase
LKTGGFFNVYNSLAAIAACETLGLPLDVIAQALDGFTGVPGRFQAVASDRDFTVIVDYAHTPDGLENVLKSARALKPRRVLVVFGCGGDRDRGKRPQMGALAANLADRIFVTSDNPRTEDPEAILRDILAGMPAESRSAALVDADRRTAIEAAIREAGSGDIVVIAGKGHEDYQIFKDRTIHFSDREVAEEILRSL